MRARATLLSWIGTSGPLGAALCFGLTSIAWAQSPSEINQEAESGESARATAAQGMFLPLLIAPGGDRASPAVALALAGYDDGAQSAVMRIAGDLTIAGPVNLRLGLTYTPDSLEGKAQPHFGVRVRLLDQAAHGLDVSALLLYRMERFTDDEGLVQAVAALGRRWGRIGLFGNAAYGQNPEGDDRELEAALALLYAAGDALQLGLESHLRVDLFSDDPKREARRDSEFDITTGPIANIGFGPIGFVAQAGAHTIKIERVRTGLIALGGVAYAY